MAFKLYATTKKGQGGFTLLNPKQAIDSITPLEGTMILTIEMVEGDATDSQINYFRHVVVPALMSEAAKKGSDYTEQDAENILLGMFACGIELEMLAQNGKKSISNLIDKSKLWIREFFNTDII